MYDRGDIDPHDYDHECEHPRKLTDKATYAEFKLLHVTAKAYLLEGKRGDFWMPRALVWNTTIDARVGESGETERFLQGHFVKAFKPNYINVPVADIFKDLDDA